MIRSLHLASDRHVLIVELVVVGMRNAENRELSCAPPRYDAKPARFALNHQVISHQVITGEQGKKYCKTLPAPFERHDSEFSEDVPNNDSLHLACMSQNLHVMKA